MNDTPDISRPRQSDIAQRAGVSISTVSRVLAGEKGISASIQTKVLGVAAELGYPLRPATNQAAGVQLEGKTILALMSAERATGDIGAFYHDIFDVLRSLAQTDGFELDIRLLHQKQIDDSLIQRVCEVDGLLAIGLDPEEEIIHRITQGVLQPVLVNSADPSMMLDCVSPSNFTAARWRPVGFWNSAIARSPISVRIIATPSGSACAASAIRSLRKKERPMRSSCFRRQIAASGRRATRFASCWPKTLN